MLAGEWVEALNTRLTLAIMDYGQGDSGGSTEREDYTALIILALSLGLTGVVVFAAVMAWNRRKTKLRRLEARFEAALKPLLGSVARGKGETLLALAGRAADRLTDHAADANKTQLDALHRAGDAINAAASRMTEWRFAPHSVDTVQDMRMQIKSIRAALRAAKLG